nr:DUF2116 family Zn-ribbon domain-containing protein [Pseudopedobacter sp.]
MEKHCLDCGQKIIGRADKKFCDDQCRSNYNNRLRAEDQTTIKKINHILLKNRKILIELNPEGKVKVTKSKMEKAGFNFAYFTHIYETAKGAQYKFCYEFGYLPIENDYFLVVKSNDI